MSLITGRDSFIQSFWYSFLELYRSLPCLWDVNCADYFRKLPRKTAYNILLEKFKELDENATVEDVKRKIDIFRTGFRREERKIREIRSREPDSDYEPTLWYYNHLSFLTDVIVLGGERGAKGATEKANKPGPSFFKFKSDDDENREPKPKKTRQDNFSIVKKCCFNLVKKHGRSVTLFDDRAFRDLINLIPMTQSEKQTINSEYIQKLVDDDELGDDTDMETTMEMTTDAAVDDDDDAPLQLIKGEIELVPCTCGKDTDETMTRHTVECPASSQQTYWNFFEVSLDSATCQICKKTLSWTNIATLKEHLQSSHPSVDFVDDDDEFQKGPPSDDGSTNDFGMMEEVYLDENLSDTEHAPKSAKRRRKKAKAPLNITGPISRENIAASLDRFKSLDCFGQYVASLMKLIPKDKCIKFQIQIVERLLQEQAAAG